MSYSMREFIPMNSKPRQQMILFSLGSNVPRWMVILEKIRVLDKQRTSPIRVKVSPADKAWAP